MDPIVRPFRTQYERYKVTWDTKFEQRQEYKYAGEDAEAEPVGTESKIDAFFAQQGSSLDPQDYAYTALHDFIKCVRDERFEQRSRLLDRGDRLALVNDRRDTTGWKDDDEKLHYARNWKEYEKRPPAGENGYFELLDVWNFYGRLKENVSISSNQ